MSSLSSVKYSILDLATIGEGKSAADSFQNALKLAQRAEALGYTRYWLAEHHNMESVGSSATVVLIGFIAGGTSSIRVGSGGIMLPNHAPLVVAEQFGTLESLYPGRIDLGLGRAPGTDQVTSMALRRDRYGAGIDFPENIQELRTYFSSENRKAKVRAIPGEGLDIPIYILGSSTDSAILAAALGLPYAFASHFAPDHFAEALYLYRKNFRPSADLAEPYVIACVNVIAADRDEDAEIISHSFLQLATGIITGIRRPLPPPAPTMEGLWNEFTEAAVRHMMRYSFIGGPQKIRTELEEFVKQTGVNELMAVGHIYDHEARIRSFEILAEICR